MSMAPGFTEYSRQNKAAYTFNWFIDTGVSPVLRS